MKVYILNHPFHYEVENLCRMFFPNADIRLVYERDDGDGEDRIVTELTKQDGFQYRVSAFVGGKHSEKAMTGEPCSDETAEYNLALCLYQTLTDIAEAMKLNVNTVKTKLRRGKERLRRELTEGGYFIE